MQEVLFVYKEKVANIFDKLPKKKNEVEIIKSYINFVIMH